MTALSAKRPPPSLPAARPAIGPAGVSLLVGILLAAAVAPLCVIEIPAMVDYVNHLARMHLLAAGMAGEVHPAYEIRWRLVPNLAMDLIVPQVARWTGVEAAARVFLAASQVLLVTGAVALERAVQGRHRAAGLCALLVLFSLPFAWGLMNFMFALGVALWGVALWIAVRDRGYGLRMAGHAALVVALFLSHFFALGLYGLTIGLFEAAMLARGRIDLRQAARLAVLMASPVAVLLAVMSLTGGGIGGRAIDWDFGLKLAWPLRFLNAYDLGLSILSGAVIALLVGLLVRAGRLALTRTGTWIGAGFLLLYAVLPRRLFDTAFIDLRVIAAAALILPAFVNLRLPTGLAGLAPAGVAAGVIVLNLASTLGTWLAYQPDYAAIRRSFAWLEAGSTVLVARRDAAEGLRDQPLYYAPTLAAPLARSFVSSLYALEGMQPIEKAPSYRHLDIRDSLDYVPPPIAVLASALRDRGGPVPSHIACWPDWYGYVYVIGEAGANPFPERLTEIASGSRFVLYRVTGRKDAGSERSACAGH